MTLLPRVKERPGCKSSELQELAQKLRFADREKRTFSVPSHQGPQSPSDSWIASEKGCRTERGYLGVVVLVNACSTTYVILVMHSTVLFIDLLVLCYGVLSTYIQALVPLELIAAGEFLHFVYNI